ncbi:uncharacterized protein CC84DRAFT_831923 [Paraphaeosphaeria sporulosa]|uniref:Uncharacterized protein n=1 Tax=Paraphaeosphaeria sporulosa TaxID=1460663 RepID=A0A177CEG1_9PLEO|nr:uncharacterized protein CC84DRAFT_831923 [Paraphaeosphaeria sporulosa]OAG05189.1 hypothetical protein CC84DRAFT_831923 [Paraphaeosphaeria sporulosa]
MHPTVLLSLLSAAVLAAPIDPRIESRAPCPSGAKRAQAYCLFDNNIPRESEAKRAEAVEAYHDIFLVTELDTRSDASRLTRGGGRCRGGISFISLEILEIGGGGDDDGAIVTHLAMYLDFWATALSLVKIVCVCGNDFIASQKVSIVLFRTS